MLGLKGGSDREVACRVVVRGVGDDGDDVDVEEDEDED